MEEENKLKVEGAEQKTKKRWLSNQKKPTFTPLTPGLKSVYFNLRSAQDTVRFAETKDMPENYAAVPYKKICWRRKIHG